MAQRIRLEDIFRPTVRLALTIVDVATRRRSSHTSVSNVARRRSSPRPKLEPS
jgi:hypothetical protein